MVDFYDVNIPYMDAMGTGQPCLTFHEGDMVAGALHKVNPYSLLVINANHSPYKWPKING